MKQNIYKGFKKTQEDDRSVTMTHDNGHKLQIVKSGLSPDLQKQLKALPLHQYQPKDVVPDQDMQPDDSNADNASDSSSTQPDAGKHVVININNGQPPAPQKADTAVQGDQSTLQAQKENDARIDAEDAAKAKADAAAVQLGRDKTAARVAPNAMGVNPALNQVPPAATAPQATLQPASLDSSMPPGGQPTPPVSPDASNMMNALPGYSQQVKAESDIAAAKENEAKTKAGLLGSSAGEEIKNQQAVQQGLDAKMKEIDDIHRDIQNGHIDPNHYMESMGAGQRVASAIGLILGGIGGGILHQENPALKFLNSQIDRDLEGQKADLGRKQNLLSALQDQYKDKIVAENMFRATRANILANQIGQAAEKSNSAQAIPNAQKAIGALMQQYMPLLQQANALDVANKMQQGGSGVTVPQAAMLSRYLIPSTDSKGSEKAIEELNGVDKTLTAHKAADDIIDKIAGQQKLSNRIMSPVQSSQEIASLKAQLYPLIQEQDPSKRLTPEAIEAELAPFVPGLRTSKATVGDFKSGVHRLIDLHSAGTGTLSKYRIPIPQYRPPAEVKTMGGIKYQKVPGGWQKVG